MWLTGLMPRYGSDSYRGLLFFRAVISLKGMKKAFLKRTADALEKMAIASAVMALFHGKQVGIVIAAACMALSYIFTALEAKK